MLVRFLTTTCTSRTRRSVFEEKRDPKNEEHQKKGKRTRKQWRVTQGSPVFYGGKCELTPGPRETWLVCRGMCSCGVPLSFKLFFPKDDNLGVLKSIRVQLRVWGWAGVGACGGEGVGGRPDPPDGRKSVRDFSLNTTSVSTGLPRAERWMVDFQSISERKGCKMEDFRLFTIGKVSIRRFSKHKWANMMQNVGFSRVYYCKSDHLSIFKAWVSENDAKCRIFADLLL